MHSRGVEPTLTGKHGVERNGYNSYPETSSYNNHTFLSLSLSLSTEMYRHTNREGVLGASGWSEGHVQIFSIGW